MRILRHGDVLCENFSHVQDEVFMKAVISLFWHICLLRQSPAYVPTESWFIAVIIVANLLTSFIVSLSGGAELTAIELATLIVVSQAAFACLVWLACYLREVVNRFAGTLAALFGCDLLLTVLFGVVTPIVMAIFAQAAPVLEWTYALWSLAVTGYILTQALNVRVAVGLLLALGMTVLKVAVAFSAIGG